MVLESNSSSGLYAVSERGKAALNLAKLVLIDMIKDAADAQFPYPELALQGSTTAICY